MEELAFFQRYMWWWFFAARLGKGERYRVKVERTFSCESDRVVDPGQCQFKGGAAALTVQAEVIPPRFQLLHGGGRQLT